MMDGKHKSINDCPVKKIGYYRMIIAECEKEIELLEEETGTSTCRKPDIFPVGEIVEELRSTLARIEAKVDSMQEYIEGGDKREKAHIKILQRIDNLTADKR